MSVCLTWLLYQKINIADYLNVFRDPCACLMDCTGKVTGHRAVTGGDCLRD